MEDALYLFDFLKGKRIFHSEITTTYSRGIK